MSVEDTLAERGKRYGDFTDHARLCQQLKNVMQNFAPASWTTSAPWEHLSDVQKQALEVIADKIARILSGDPNYADNWHDIQGYAKLVEDRLPKEPATPDKCPFCYRVEGAMHHPDCPTRRRGKSRVAELQAQIAQHLAEYEADPRNTDAVDAFRASAVEATLRTRTEPATQIAEDTPRQQAVEQNGNDGAVYDDPWYGAPGWAKYKAQDENGAWFFYSHEPRLGKVAWVRQDMQYDFCARHEVVPHPGYSPGWRNTLIQRP